MLLYATGIRLFAAKNAPILIKNAKIISGERILGSEIPAAFIASNSLFSPNPPMVMIDANSVARGRASGINVAAPHPRNSAITPKPRPFPTSSSMYNQRNCNSRANVTIKNVKTNGPKNDFNMNWSIFFTCVV
ncbi:hypothetical protein SDC9_212309 [bioreactor metagenome]|uniref:Uncharacterized protein n=1 Tax=bioreactor metagenome TaxID=1076179 RepID=A0A645JYF0_9ZZZZ